MHTWKRVKRKDNIKKIDFDVNGVDKITFFRSKMYYFYLNMSGKTGKVHGKIRENAFVDDVGVAVKNGGCQSINMVISSPQFY